MADQMMWVPEPVHRRTVGLLRGWVIALAVVVLLGLLVLGAVLFRAVFVTTSFPAEFVRLVEAADGRGHSLSEEEPHGVVVAIIDTDGERSGYLRGLRTLWVQGEPAHEQDLPLGVEFTPAGCTVTTAG